MRIVKKLIFLKSKNFMSIEVTVEELVVRISDFHLIDHVGMGYEKENRLFLQMDDGKVIEKENESLSSYLQKFGKGKERFENGSEFIILHEPSSPEYVQGIARAKKLTGPAEEIERLTLHFPERNEVKVLERVSFRISNESLIRMISELFGLCSNVIVGYLLMDNGDKIVDKKNYSFLDYLLKVGEVSNFFRCYGTLVLNKGEL